MGLRRKEDEKNVWEKAAGKIPGDPWEDQREREKIANQYMLKCYAIAMIALTFVWFLNSINVFVVDKRIMNTGFVPALFFFAAAAVITRRTGLSRPWVKYLLMTLFICSMTAAGTMLTYHVVTASVFPILYSVMYSSPRLTRYTLLLMIVSTVLVVFLGYYYGLCDANMVLLTRTGTMQYISQEGVFELNKPNSEVTWTLLLYFVFPRCILYTLLIPVCRNIARIFGMLSRQADTMKELAEKDSLTGLSTRGAGERQIRNLLNQNSSGVFCIMDIDDFKSINDRFGHFTGDKVLIEISRCLRETFREGDVMTRLGGDEFAVFLTGANSRDVSEQCIRRLYQKISCIDVKETMGETVSISLGGIYFEKEAQPAYEDLYCLGDQMLYLAKNNGKGQYLLHCYEKNRGGRQKETGGNAAKNEKKL